MLNGKRRQKGQMMVYVTVMLLVIVGAVFYVFDGYTISSEKTRLQGTADAAAYSVAAVEARNLNFQAYTNRAMIANHVAVAQATTLVSWSRWLDRTAENLSRVTQLILPVGVVTTIISQAASTLNATIEQVARVANSALDKLILAISASQQVMHANTVMMARQAYSNVVKANDNEVDAVYTLTSLDSFRKAHFDFSKQYSPDKAYDACGSWSSGGWTNTGSGFLGWEWNPPEWTAPGSEIDRQYSDEFRNILLKSRDRFTTRRNQLAGVMKTKVTVPLVSRFWMERDGGTELIRNTENCGPYFKWSSVDTLSMHYALGEWDWGVFQGYDDKGEMLPVGWGAAQSGKNSNDRIDYRETHGDKSYWKRNGMASGLARWEFGQEQPVTSYVGMRDFRALAEPGLLDEGPGLIVAVTKPASAKGLQTATELTGASGCAEQAKQDDFMDGRMVSIAKSRVIFRYPHDLHPRSSGRREYGSLYSPYWQPALDDLTSLEKLGIRAELGVTGNSAGAVGEACKKAGGPDGGGDDGSSNQGDGLPESGNGTGNESPDSGTEEESNGDGNEQPPVCDLNVTV